MIRKVYRNWCIAFTWSSLWLEMRVSSNIVCHDDKLTGRVGRLISKTNSRCNTLQMISWRLKVKSSNVHITIPQKKWVSVGAIISVIRNKMLVAFRMYNFTQNILVPIYFSILPNNFHNGRGNGIITRSGGLVYQVTTFQIIIWQIECCIIILRALSYRYLLARNPGTWVFTKLICTCLWEMVSMFRW